MIGVGDIRLFRSVIFLIWFEYGDLLFRYLYSVRMRENTDQQNSEYTHYSCGDSCDEEKYTFFSSVIPQKSYYNIYKLHVEILRVCD